jgi:hypothetical protein
MTSVNYKRCYPEITTVALRARAFRHGDMFYRFTPIPAARMRDVPSRVLEMSLSGGSVRSVGRDVRLAMVDECGVLVRLLTMGRMSTSVHG